MQGFHGDKEPEQRVRSSCWGHDEDAKQPGKGEDLFETNPSQSLSLHQFTALELFGRHFSNSKTTLRTPVFIGFSAV